MTYNVYYHGHTDDKAVTGPFFQRTFRTAEERAEIKSVWRNGDEDRPDGELTRAEIFRLCTLGHE